MGTHLNWRTTGSSRQEWWAAHSMEFRWRCVRYMYEVLDVSCQVQDARCEVWDRYFGYRILNCSSILWLRTSFPYLTDLPKYMVSHAVVQYRGILQPQVTAEGVVWGCLVSDKDGNNAFHQAQHSSTYILIYKYVIVFNKYKLDRNHKLHWSSIAFVLNLFFIDNLTLHILCRNRFSISTCIQSPMFYEHVLRLWQWKFDFLVKFSTPAMCLFASFSDPSQHIHPLLLVSRSM